MSFKEKINELKRCQLNCNVFSVYDYQGYTIQELLCEFFTKINECIKLCNNVIDLAEWLVNEGLEKEVAEKLQQWLEDGTLANIINKTLFKELNEKIEKTGKSHATYNLLLEGCVGDGKTDNKEIIENIFNKLSNGDSVYIPYGTFLVKLSDNDLKDVGMSRKALYPWIVKNGVENLTIFGNGVIKYECDKNMTKKASTIMFKNCSNLKLKDFTEQGDVKFSSDDTYLDVGLNGINLVNCKNSIVNGIKQFNMLSVLGVTGDIDTPSPSNVVNDDVIITNCIFKDYGQVSTFGNGVSRLIFSNNLCINPMQSGFKISTNVIGNHQIGKSGDIIIDGNVIYWEDDYRFPQVGWDKGKSFCPVGVMIESHSNNIKISNNIIDLSKISDKLLNPITDYAPIFLLGGYLEDEIINYGVEVTNNKLYGVNNSSSIIFNPNYGSLSIKNNELDGGLDGRTFTPNNVGKTKGVYIENNTFLSDFKLPIKNIKTSCLCVKNNLALNSSNKTVESLIIEENEIDYLVIENNQLPHEIFKTYNDLISKNISIKNNSLKAISNLSCSGNEVVLDIINNNFTARDITLATININNDDNIINFSGNGGKTTGSVININKGLLHLNNNSVKAQTGVPYVIGSAIVQSGFFMGSGEPTMEGGVGVMYRNINVVTPSLYIKVGDGQGADKWKEI